MSPASTVHGGQHNTKYICDIRVAIACGIRGWRSLGFMLEPARTSVEICRPQLISPVAFMNRICPDEINRRLPINWNCWLQQFWHSAYYNNRICPSTRVRRLFFLFFFFFFFLFHPVYYLRHSFSLSLLPGYMLIVVTQIHSHVT